MAQPNIASRFSEGRAEAIVRDGRVVSFTYTLSPESLARLRQADTL
jgi:hypothetical protein